MLKYIYIALLSIHLVEAQEVPTYSRVDFVQYPDETDMMDVDTAELKPTKRFSLRSQRIPFAWEEEFEKYVRKGEVFKEKIGNDSITVEVGYGRFDHRAHQMDTINYLIDAKKVFGHDGFSLHLFDDNSYIKSIVLRSNGRTIISFPDVKPFLFWSNCSSAEKIFDRDLYRLSFTGSDGAGSYWGFFLFNSTGNIWCYVEAANEGAHRPVGKDLFATNGQYQYLINDYKTWNACEFASAEVAHNKDYKGWTDYWNKNKKENLTLCKSLDLSELIESDSTNGETGHFERKPFFVYIESATKDKRDSLLYHVKGVNKLGNTISPFDGALKIKYATRTYSADRYSKRHFAYLTGDYIIQEDPSKRSSGQFLGAFHIAIESNEPTFSNFLAFKNLSRKQYSGKFTLYNNKVIKLCEWGDASSHGYPEQRQWWKK